MTIPVWAGALILAGALTATFSAIAAVTAVIVCRNVTTPHRRQFDDTLVAGFDAQAHTITLSRSPDTTTAGEYSFVFGRRGHARLGEIIALARTTVTRRVLGVDSGDLSRARAGRVRGMFYCDPVALGIPVTEVRIDTALGAAPAWFVPTTSPSTRWLIQVHGHDETRRECIRSIPVAHQNGYNSLLISYRNDGEAPTTVDGRYGLGATEWCDVDDAITYAAAQGATDVVLMGWSMGGATVLQAVGQSARADVVRGIILESPVLDWARLLRFQAGLRKMPTALTHCVLVMMRALFRHQRFSSLTGQRSQFDLRELDFVRRSAELTLPILLLHSDADAMMPISSAHEFARARPDIVTFERFPIAAHARLWNHDRERWNSTIELWLAGLVLDDSPLATRTD